MFIAYGVKDYASYVLGAAFIILLPGPNAFHVLALAARHGVRVGYQGALGVFAGDTILMLLSATGMASILVSSPELYRAIKTIGALYLAWLGVGIQGSAWLSWRVASDGASLTIAYAGADKPFRSALAISLMNPKAIIFFTSFFVQFVDPDYAYPALSFAILGLTCQLLGGLYLSVLIFGGTYQARQVRSRHRLTAGATAGIGVVFIGFGIKLADSNLS